MERKTELHAVIRRLYCAASGSVDVTWESALFDLKRAVQAHAVALCEFDVSRREMMFYVAAGDVPPGARHSYKRSFYLSDPLMKRLHVTATGRWVHCHELFDDAFVANDRFYQEYLLPNGGRWVSGIKLSETGDVAISLLVTRREDLGPLTGDDFLACDLLSFHVERAYAFAQLHARLQRQHAAAELVMQHLGSPIFLLDGECRLLFSNTRARSLMSHGSVFSERDGRLSLANPEDNRALRALAEKLYRTADEHRSTTSAYLMFAASEHVGIARPARPRVAGMMLILLRDQDTSASGACQVLLAVVHEVKGDPQPDPNILVSAFGLTKAESEVAICVAQGMSVAQIAQLRCKAVSTVRSQVKSILQKMRCTRQSEVMSRVRSIPFIFFGLRGGDDDAVCAAFSPRPPPQSWPGASAMSAPDDID